MTSWISILTCLIAVEHIEQATIIIVTRIIISILLLLMLLLLSLVLFQLGSIVAILLAVVLELAGDARGAGSRTQLAILQICRGQVASRHYFVTVNDRHLA